MNLMQVITGGGGILLVYCGIKGYTPRDVIVYAFGGSKPMTFQEKSDNANDPLASGNAHLNPDGTTTPGPKAFPDGPDAGTDGANGNPLTPSLFNPTTDPPPNVTGV